MGYLSILTNLLTKYLPVLAESVNTPELARVVTEAEIGGLSLQATMAAVVKDSETIFPNPFVRMVAVMLLNDLMPVAAAKP